jgi:cytochrome c oxidase assembly protein subunit 15
MIFVQVILGGITRLTGSGLSITKWEIVTGTLPPLNEAQWQREFDLYKQTPQYRQINEGMSLGEFKFIYFWEYLHRLWARLMGVVFLIPFIYFYVKKQLSALLLRRLTVVFLLACLVASFGWIMVASGLVDKPWVSPYKLTVHLNLAIFLFGYLLWTTLQQMFPEVHNDAGKKLRKLSRWIFVLLAAQLFLGGLMSGMKAGLFYPTWPKMGDRWFPQVILNYYEWKLESLFEYYSRPFAIALVQITHRMIAYALVLFVLWWYWRLLERINDTTGFFFRIVHFLPAAITLQVLLGIITIINCVGSIPLLWGVLHQAGAIMLLAVMLKVQYFSFPRNFT